MACYWKTSSTIITTASAVDLVAADLVVPDLAAVDLAAVPDSAAVDLAGQEVARSADRVDQEAGPAVSSRATSLVAFIFVDIFAAAHRATTTLQYHRRAGTGLRSYPPPR